MHRCLNIQEVLLNIFEEVNYSPSDAYGETDWSPSRAASVAALASTCKIFYHPAIKVLWRHLPSLAVISHLMDESTFELEDGVIYPVEDLDENFAKRLSFYAPMVKRIDAYNAWETRRLHPTVLLELNSFSLIPTPLFCNLERVDIPCYVDDPMEAMFYPAVVLGSPSLVEVNVVSDDQMEMDGGGQLASRTHPTQWESLTNRLIPFASQLRKLWVYSSSSSISCQLLAIPQLARLCGALSDSITDLDVAFFQLPRSTMASFHSLNNLVKLTVSVDDETFGDLGESRDGRIVFPRLFKLQVTAMSMASGASFISSVDAKQLQELTINVNIGALADGEVDLGMLVDALSQWTSTPAFSKLYIRRHVQDGPEGLVNGEFVFKVTDATLRPLVAFPNMEHLSISPCINFLTDEGLLEIFSSWKHLKAFSVHREETSILVQEGLQLSLAGVALALQKCPRLYHLVLECDFKEIPSSSAIKLLDNLYYWRVDCSPIANGRSFVEWANIHLPSLGEVEYFSHLRHRIRLDFEGVWEGARQSMLYLDQWNDVLKLLKGASRSVDNSYSASS
ncbi:hypothetical protein BKA70DRAFT_235792 [Coprinopsis sp. MPI-PUGE-AT-0042]|nr:hypothetical protein BKA70DRAFT_235792 [Coprinopsis sp. MPI-PUGE-AT-0042]